MDDIAPEDFVPRLLHWGLRLQLFRWCVSCSSFVGMRWNFERSVGVYPVVFSRFPGCRKSSSGQGHQELGPWFGNAWLGFLGRFSAQGPADP